ncbi:Der GTPase-activating protein YihI [Oceanisphaera avium]|uniref:Der GTPase-activating protein YihI n=1 Tax=Oceanisphaera avium TaxID=1903694 RepID=A0A1Y0D068_9GAMM|nr:Der GTPase-activating protein YihI [Oceanisphaera avium]ART80415.1 GTPase-activating protein [Oceanisphaera avium]
MTRIKKSRTPGQLAASKNTRETAAQTKERQRKAKRKGLAPGSRQNVPELHEHNKDKQAPTDPRLGSKKPVPLGPATNTDAPETKKFTKPAPVAKITVIDECAALSPEQELEQLENDERLNTLLDQVDAGKKLAKADGAWLDARLARHQQLLEQLGLLDEEDDEANEGDDLWTRFMDTEFDPAQYEDKEDKS